MLASTGHKAIQLFLFLRDIAVLIFRAFRDAIGVLRHGLRPSLRVFLKQVYFTGVEAFGVVVALFLLIGILIISQIISFAGAGSAPLTGKVLVWIVVRELGPLLTAVIVIARSGTAIATELATMKLGGELDVLEALGIPCARYLVMPRILGVATAVLVLTVYAEVVSVGGGILAASLVWRISFDLFHQGIVPFLTFREIGISAFKSLAFGLLVSAVCCRQGLSVGESLTEVPQAATKGVMRSLLLVFLSDAVITAATLP
jgi:phospholipid/cholesterol/gamma-HCH transport system permease protein